MDGGARRPSGPTKDIRAEFVETILESSSDAIIGARLDGTIAFWNPGAARLYGYTEDEVLGRSIRLIIPSDRVEENAEILRRLNAGEGLEPYDTVRVRKDGERVDVSTTITPFLDENGQRRGAISISRSIAARKQMEEELRRAHDELEFRVEARTMALEKAREALERELVERNRIQAALEDSEAWFRAIYEQARIGIVLVNLARDGALIDANPAHLEMLGYTLDELKAMTYDSIIHPDDMPLAREMFQALIRGEHTHHTMDRRWFKKDGSILWTSVSVSVVRSADNKPRFAIVLVEDITERKRASSELQKREHQLNEAQRQAKLGSWELELATNTMTWSDEMHRILGQNPALHDISTKSVMLNVHPEDRQKLREAVSRAMRTGELVDFEHRIVAPDGSERTLLSRAQAILDGDGKAIRIVGSAQDITAQKEAGEQLRAAREEADRANFAKSEFLSRMSHELRTPLSAVLGFSELLQLGMVNDSDLADSYNSIHKAGQHLLHLINDVLDISSIEAGRLRFSVEPVSLSEVTVEVLQLVRSMAVSHKITIHNDITPDTDAYVSADRQRLKQVLVNLLVNGIKYNRVGGSVTITTGESESGDFRIQVHDTGPGMSPEQLERLFTPFDRLGAERTEVEGTGLGLALSKRLTEAMDGVLGVDSVAGQGSTFWIELPPAVGHADHLPSSEAMIDVVDTTPKETLHTVLYIEDNLTSIKLVERIMQQRQGIKLLVAMQGRVGLEFARQHLPDLILLDLQLPDIQGNEVLLRLKADPATRNIPVVMLSADATPRQQENLLRAGAQTYLTKPLSVRRLLKILEELLPAVAA